MGRAERAGGRPRKTAQGVTPELAELGEFLRAVVDESGQSVAEVRAKFTKEHFPGPLPIPSISTMYKRFSGEGLESAGRLVDVIVDICTPPERLEEVRAKAAMLKSMARTTRTLAGQAPTSDDCRTHLSQLAEARHRIIEMQDELIQLREEARGGSERKALDLSRVLRDLDEANADRKGLSAELAAARRRIQALEERLSASTAPVKHEVDLELDRLEGELRRLDPTGARFAAAIRRAFDAVYDGARTGRFSPDQLSRVEKSYLSEVVISELAREFDLKEDANIGFQIGGITFDCRFARLGKWLISPELNDQLCLLVSADDKQSSFSVGLVRITPDILTVGANRDAKRMVSQAGRDSIRFLVRGGALPENALLRIDNANLEAILAEPSGQDRVQELFRRVQNRPIDRASLRAVAMQEDVSKRARSTRRALAAEGILVLGYKDASICAELGLPKLGHNEFMSVRMTPRASHHHDLNSTEIKGQRWVVAAPEDPVEPIPET